MAGGGLLVCSDRLFALSDKHSSQPTVSQNKSSQSCHGPIFCFLPRVPRTCFRCLLSRLKKLHFKEFSQLATATPILPVTLSDNVDLHTTGHSRSLPVLRAPADAREDLDDHSLSHLLARAPGLPYLGSIRPPFFIEQSLLTSSQAYYPPELANFAATTIVNFYWNSVGADSSSRPASSQPELSYLRLPSVLCRRGFQVCLF